MTADNPNAIAQEPNVDDTGVDANMQAGSSKRDRWTGRWTFILAAVGSAVGLGNFWRFPSLTYKYGGFGNFAIPYLLCLFGMGIPLLLMELGLGQKFQRGDVSVFRSINKQLAGIGVASVFSSYFITFYYTVIIAWSCVYVVAAFSNPLPWDPMQRSIAFPDARDPNVKNPVMFTGGTDKKNIKKFRDKCLPRLYYTSKNITKITADSLAASRAREFFYVDVVQYFGRDTCLPFNDETDSTQFSIPSFGACIFVWATIFLAIFNGVHGSSYIVWLTVPIPLIFIIVMMVRGLLLPGAFSGISQYIQGDPVKAAKIDLASMWADAAGQIFFSIGVCMGIMTSYGSYNPIRKPIILDNIIIAITNSSVSFVSGFAVWSIVGFLQNSKSVAAANTGGTDLVFIAYPVATLKMQGSAGWTFLLGLTLFLLGVDSAFSMVEAVSTVLSDTQTFKGIHKALLALMLCLIGLGISALFCTNWGYILFDCIDHYLGNYLLLLVGILQCAGVGWAFEYEKTKKKSEAYANSMDFLVYGYWIFLFITGAWSISAGTGKYGMLAFMGVLSCFVLPISFWQAETTVTEWYNDIVMCGVRRIGWSMSKLGRDNEGDRAGVENWYEKYFVFYWCITIKYLIPMVLWFILLYVIKKDLTVPYGKYKLYWQLIGLCVPVIGLVAFLINIWCCVYQEDLDEVEFSTEWTKATDEQLGISPEERAEMDRIKAEEDEGAGLINGDKGVEMADQNLMEAV